MSETAGGNAGGVFDDRSGPGGGIRTVKGAIGAMAWRIGQGELLAGGVAAAALVVLVFVLDLNPLLAILLAVGIYAGIVLLAPSRVEPAGDAIEGATTDPPIAVLPEPLGSLSATDSSWPNTNVAPAAARYGLTPREYEIVVLLEQRLTNNEIAARLFIAPRTVENHVARILDKLELTSRRDVSSFVAEHGLLPPSTPQAAPE